MNISYDEKCRIWQELAPLWKCYENKITPLVNKFMINCLECKEPYGVKANDIKEEFKQKLNHVNTDHFVKIVHFYHVKLIELSLQKLSKTDESSTKEIIIKNENDDESKRND